MSIKTSFLLRTCDSVIFYVGEEIFYIIMEK